MEMKKNMTTYTVLLSILAVAAGAIIGFDVYVDDSNSKMTIQEASAERYLMPNGDAPPFGRLPPTANLPIWTPGGDFPPGSGQPATLENVNVVFSTVIPYLGGWIHYDVSHYFSDPSVSFRYVTLILNAGYDASAPYHETAVGVYSNIENRPAAEYENTDRYINKATMHAIYQLAMAFDPSKKAHWDAMMTNIDLDPNDKRGLDYDCSVSQRISDPVVIGNFAGKCVLEGRANDGFNDDVNGYAPSGSYPIVQDTTGYTPVSSNSPDYYSKWQPLEITRYNQNVTQEFVTPQWANTEQFTQGLNPRDIRTSAPLASDYVNNKVEYRNQSQEVVDAVAGLDDRKKMIAEYFDNKAREVLFFPLVESNPVTDNNEFGMDTTRTADFFRLDFMLHIAQFDAGIVAWQEKTLYDAVRPITAIQHIYANEVIPTFNNKTVMGSDWQPYVGTGDHPEYPSATACFCAAQAEAWKAYYGGSDDIPIINGKPGFQGTLVNGSSIYERGTTPAENVTISYTTWSDFVKDCGESRIWSGLHFRSAVEESINTCNDVGRDAFAYFETLMDGTADSPRSPAKALSKDIMLYTNAAEQAWLAANPSISVGYSNWPPFEYYGNDGLAGISGAMAAKFSEVTGSDFVADSGITWGQTLSGLKSGDIGVAFMITDTGSSDTERTGIAYTSPWYFVDTNLIVKSGNPYEVTKDNLADKRVVSVEGYAVNTWLTANNISFTEVASTAIALNGVADGTYDVHIESWEVASRIGADNGITGLYNAGVSGYQYALSIGYDANNAVLGDILQKTLDATQSGRAQLIADALAPPTVVRICR